MVAIGEFGEPLTECRVEKFQSTTTTKDYRERFRGLAASELPDGEYRVEISCRGARALDHVKVAGEAHILDPDPGSYLVGVLSSRGYSCLHEIDLVDRTRLWTFDAEACAFQVDAFAHVVTDEDKRELKTTGWYQELRKSEEQLWRAVDRLAKGANDSNSAR
jgi:hypothetical protein